LNKIIVLIYFAFFCVQIENENQCVMNKKVFVSTDTLTYDPGGK